MSTDDTYNLYILNSYCEISGFTNENTLCQIGSKNRVDIIFNGEIIDPEKEYSLIIYSLNTPNVDTSSY